MDRSRNYWMHHQRPQAPRALIRSKNRLAVNASDLMEQARHTARITGDDPPQFAFTAADVAAIFSEHRDRRGTYFKLGDGRVYNERGELIR